MRWNTPALILAAALLLASCSPSPSPSSPAPVPAVTVTTTATVSPTPLADLSPAPSPSSEVYRIRAEFLSSTELTFEVTLNGRKIGSFNTDSQNDVTPLIQEGANEVSVAWSKASTIQDNGKAMLFLESQRPGQETWNTLFSREVARTTRDTSASGTFEVGDSSTQTSPATPQAAAPDTSEVSVAGRYVVKIKNHVLAPAEFHVSINGGSAQTYTASGDQDITANLQPGPNTIVVGFKSLKNVTNTAWKSTLTIGVERDGKWATVGNQSVGKDEPEGSRTFTFDAPAAP